MISREARLNYQFQVKKKAEAKELYLLETKETSTVGGIVEGVAGRRCRRNWSAGAPNFLVNNSP